MKISWKDKLQNEDALKTVMAEKLQLREKIVKDKLLCAGHVLWGSSGSGALLILEGKFEGKKHVTDRERCG
jgi:hypothetical protein